jgi:hypothetical protein
MSREYIPGCRNLTFGNSRPWDQDEINRFCDLIADGVSIGAAGRSVSRDRNSAQSKWRQIRLKMGWQAQ